jgi:hypothetical protein
MRVIWTIVIFVGLGSVAPAEASSLDREAIRRPVLARSAALRICYQGMLDRDSRAEGTITPAFSILQDGRVTEVTVDLDFGDRTFGECVTAVFAGLRFGPQPAPSIRIHYPLTFRRQAATPYLPVATMNTLLPLSSPSGILAAALGAPLASAPTPFLDTGFGVPVANLRLAVTVDRGGIRASFHVKNVGRKPITFVVEYSCSGLSPWSISIGDAASALERHFGYEPRLAGLTSRMETDCTVNGATALRTIRPKETTTILVPFAKADEITKSTETFFQANAAIHIEGSGRLLYLRSPLVYLQARP